MPDVRYENASVQLQPGDQLVFYTDGITESTDAADRMFGVKRLDEVLTECRNDPAEIVRAILERVEHFTGSLPATDDRTVVAAKVQ